MKTTISVIVPIYKVEPYIHKCLDSVVNQTVTPYEVILVNDGSPDRCGEIAMSYVERYPFFKYIAQENLGLSAARNVGMSVATGEFITFLDSDDYWTPDAYEEMVRLVESNVAELYLFELLYVDKEGRPLSRRPQTFSGDIVVYGTEVLERKDYFRGFMVCYEIFRRSIIVGNQLDFPVGIQHQEDAIFVSRYLPFVNRIVQLEKPLYMYVQREGSITHIGHTNAKAQHFLNSIYIVLDDWKQRDRNIPFCVINTSIVSSLKQYYKVYLKKDDLQRSEMREVCHEIRRYIREAEKYGIELPYKRKMLLISYFFPLFRIYYRWQERWRKDRL